eukprot:TRINITY_DN105_c0_g1_i1.p1 TRINITY_DN105_c0_g1~~TRINITY_DN105_c0_g1_i1.p1  ORF type:complete len:303 (+),score=98.91 TRINITY_DN105_c0_g1_i1:103-1011(+)
MAQKKGNEGGGGAGKKKVQDPFSKKEWFEIKAPDYFSNKKVGKMPVNKSAGARNAEDDLKGRIVEVNLADLQGKEGDSYRKIKLRVEDVQGRYALTNFYGMDFTTDKLRSLIKKWQTLIEASVEAKTTDGYYLRIFAIGFTKKRDGQQKKTCYAQTSQVKAIRARMREIMLREATSCSLRELVLKFIPEAIGNSIERECSGIYPLDNCYIRKVKLLQSPKFDVQTLASLHDKKGMPDVDVGVAVEEAPAAAEEGEKKEKAAAPAKEAAKDSKAKPAAAKPAAKDTKAAAPAAKGKGKAAEKK